MLHCCATVKCVHISSMKTSAVKNSWGMNLWEAMDKFQPRKFITGMFLTISCCNGCYSKPSLVLKLVPLQRLSNLQQQQYPAVCVLWSITCLVRNTSSKGLKKKNSTINFLEINIFKNKENLSSIDAVHSYTGSQLSGFWCSLQALQVHGFASKI